MDPRVRKSDGFVLAEAAVLIVVVAVLAALLLVAAGESRRQSSLGDNLANLKQFAHGTGAFAADNDDRVWTYTGATIADSAAQAWQILRDRSGHPEWLGPNPPVNWLPHILYSHLPLLDYLETALPERFAIAPEDRRRLLWASDLLNFESLPPDQRPPGSGTIVRRWPFSSSYELPPAFYSPDAGNTVLQSTGSSHNIYIASNVPLGGRRLSEVALPAQKVMLFEQYQRHFGPRVLYFGYPETRLPMMLADGSAAVRRTSDANRGFIPNSPQSPAFTRIYYVPDSWEPPTASGQAQDLVLTYYRFTRSGLRGRDFGGPEIPWVD